MGTSFPVLFLFPSFVLDYVIALFISTVKRWVLIFWDFFANPDFTGFLPCFQIICSSRFFQLPSRHISFKQFINRPIQSISQQQSLEAHKRILPFFNIYCWSAPQATNKSRLSLFLYRKFTCYTVMKKANSL